MSVEGRVRVCLCLGGCVEPCVKNIPTVNYECVCVCAPCVRVIVNYKCTGPLQGQWVQCEHVAHGANIQMMKWTKEKRYSIHNLTQFKCFCFFPVYDQAYYSFKHAVCFFIFFP